MGRSRESEQPAREHTLLSLPSPGDDVGSATCTVEVRGVAAPPIGSVDDRPSGTQALLRAFLPGVTNEHGGRYTISDDAAKSELGRGGIGRVYVALDRHLEREVAVKELLSDVLDADGAAGLSAVSRFLREARVTGQLEHPNIVPVYELGKRDDGTLYYTMRVVRGRTLSRAIAEASTLGERLPLVNHFSGLCQAMAYAHSRGVVHRDIKPDNVMIGEFGETIVLDWGMAKLQAGDERDTEMPAPARYSRGDLTLEGSVCGTPLFMSPEQAQGLTREVDERSDIWSLGAVLYTILLGRPPFSGRTVLEIVDRVKRADFVPLRTADPNVPPELAAVCERALRSVKSERYASARELARDIQAYQAGARVGVYDYSSWQLLKRFVARHRAAVIASALGLGAVVALGTAAYGRVVRERDRAVAAEHRARASERSAQQNLEEAKQSLGAVLLDRANQALGEGDLVGAELLAAHALELRERAEARGVVIAAESTPRPVLQRNVPELGGCTRSALDPSHALLACARGTTLELWSVERRSLRWTLPFTTEIMAIAFAGRVGSIAVAVAEGSVQLRQVADSRLTFERRSIGPTTVAVSEDGRHVACGTTRGDAELWDTIGPAPVRRLALRQAVSALAFAPRGTLLAVGGELGAISVLDMEAGDARAFGGHAGTVRGLAFAEAGRYLASGGADRAIRFWDTRSGTQPLAPVLHSDAVTSIAWSHDGRFLAYAGKDRSVRVRDLRGSARGVSLREHEAPVELLALSQDGNSLTAVSERDGMKTWSLERLRVPRELVERGNVLALATVRDRRELVSAGLGQHGVCIWNLGLGECSTRLPAGLDRVRALAVSPDSRLLALGGSGSNLFVWDLTQRVPRHILEGHREEARALTFSADSRLLVSGGLDGRLRVFDAEAGHLLRQVATGSPVQALAFVRGGRVAVGHRSGAVSEWDIEHGREILRFRAHEDWVLSVAVAAGGRHLASAGADARVRIWDTEPRRLRFELSGHEGKVLAIDYSPDGALLASAGEDKTIRVWDTTTGRERARLPPHDAAVRVVRFLPKGPLLASGSDDGSIRLWDLAELTTPALPIRERLEASYGITLEDMKVVARRSD